MNKQDFIKVVRENLLKLGKDKEFEDSLSFNQDCGRKIVDCFFDSITEVLEKEDELKIVNWGAFNIKTTKERIGRNPKTGEPIPIKPKKIVKFRAGKTMADRIEKSLSE